MTRAWFATFAEVARRPSLWGTAAVQAARLARPGARAWLRFRIETQYGDPQHPPVPEDVVRWLRWAKAQATRRPRR